jgi:hypothetical protein
MRDEKKRAVAFTAALASVVALWSGSAFAGSIDYGTFPGADVSYGNVTENYPTAIGPLYGSPTVSADAISFACPQFSISAAAGGSTTTTGDVNTLVSANAGHALSGIWFTEAGDYTLVGSGTSATYVSISAPVSVTIDQVNGSPITPITVTSLVTFTPDSPFTLTADGGAGIQFSGTDGINLNDILASNSISGQATQVYWDLENTLYATSEADTVALIAVKAGSSDTIAVTPMIVGIPEPTSFCLLAMGASGLLMRRRRA